MKSPVFAHIPYTRLHENLETIIAKRINPEVFITGEGFDHFIPEKLIPVAEALAANGLQATMHAPFIDLNPGSAEPLVREATLRRLNQAFDAAEILRPRVIVCHPGYDRWRYGEAQDQWLGHSVEIWRHLLPRAEKIGCTIAVENIFEEEPSTLRALIEAIDSPLLRHCFDVGHWNLFGKTTMEEWFAELGNYIAETHIHDNHGRRDDHAVIGEGNIDFDLFFSLMGRYAPAACWTIEAHSRDALERALATIEQYR